MANQNQAGSTAPATVNQQGKQPGQTAQASPPQSAFSPQFMAQAGGIMQAQNENLQRNVMPQIGSAAQVAGQYGGSRQGVLEANALKDMNNSMFSQLGNLAMQDRSMTNQELVQGSQLANQAEQNQMQKWQTLLGLGGQLQGYNQSQIDADKSRWDFNQDSNWQNIQKLSSVMMPGANLGTSQVTNTTRNPVSGAMGGAMGGAMLGNMLGVTSLGPYALAGGLLGLF